MPIVNDKHVVVSLAAATAQVLNTNINAVGPFRMRGTVVHGFNRGSKLLGYPTANLDPAAFESVLLQQPRGVYAGFIRIHPSPVVYKTVLSLGLNPTFTDSVKETVECYIMHKFDADFYGSEMSLLLCAYMRPQEQYSGMEPLMAAIANDEKVGSEALDTQFSHYSNDAFFHELDNSKL